MAYTESTMLPLGAKAPDFNLPDASTGNLISLYDIAGAKATLVMFICNHCPYVIHVNPVWQQTAKVLEQFKSRTVLKKIPAEYLAVILRSV